MYPNYNTQVTKLALNIITCIDLDCAGYHNRDTLNSDYPTWNFNTN